MNTSALIELAQSAKRNTTLLAYLVAAHMETERQTWEQVAAYLGITPDQLAVLSLCNRPRKEWFFDDTARIADYVGIEAAKLNDFVRRTQVIDTMQRGAKNQWLMAARDKGDDSSSENSE